MATRTAEVRFKGEVAGGIRQEANGDSTFAYQAGWSLPIGCTLPLTPNIHSWRSGLHPFFQHIGAEGWLRERQARVSALDEDDDLGLLLRYGRDCIGAVSIHDPTNGRPQRADSGGLEAATKAALDAQRTISGVQKKLLVIKTEKGFEPAGHNGPAPYIAKFNNADIDTFVRNEALTLVHARELLGRDLVTKASIGNVEGVGTALLVERFDRTADNEKLRLEDFAQVLNISRRADNGGKYDASYEDIAGALRKYSELPEVDILRFFRLVVANAVLGNCDAHLKNFSLLETADGLRLAPAYDVVNTVLYHDKGYSTQFALRINGSEQQHDRIDHALLIQFGQNIGLNERAVSSALEDLKKRSQNVVANIKKSIDGRADNDFIERYYDIVASAAQRILP